MSKSRRNRIQLGARRWTAYSAAGLATAMGTQSVADADIFHFVVNERIQDPDVVNGPNSVGATVTHRLGTGPSGVIDLRLRHAASLANSGIARGSILGTNLAAGAFAGFTSGTFRYPRNVPYGQLISALTQFTAGNSSGTMAFNAGYTNSEFLNAGQSFLAFRFDVGNGTQFGWARVIMDGSTAGVPNAFTLVDYAFASPGQSIFVGQIAAVPEPSSLGVLAAGAIGLLAWRKSRRKSAPKN